MELLPADGDAGTNARLHAHRSRESVSAFRCVGLADCKQSRTWTPSFKVSSITASVPGCNSGSGLRVQVHPGIKEAKRAVGLMVAESRRAKFEVDEHLFAYPDYEVPHLMRHLDVRHCLALATLLDGRELSGKGCCK